ncbi:GNAT family N-acetyltransferase [Kribbella sp. NBC_01245]|uniref:GNAT family N-acetyltransferase n=1 Tax=Kribbella sp. NBC_01245 TaxID=2903578 RepID=UPI002E2B576A|nr:GNAT family N-acetyltransferase [Kribbella sp. NBC_01245]
MDLDELVREWAFGWAVSRGTAMPVEVVEGLRVDVGRPGQVVRYVLPRYDVRVVPELAKRLEQTGSWLKVCAEPEVVREALPAGWRVEPPEFLMSKSLSVVPEPQQTTYGVEVAGDGPLVEVRVVAADGEVAARGQGAFARGAMTVDQVVTEPAHRRRGLGRTVMAALERAAVERGVDRGVLVATEDGLGLYGSLGWALDSPVTAAVRV